MKKLISQLVSFLSYHNAVPIVISVLFVGGASAFAATATGVLPMPALTTPSAPESVHVDTSALLAANVDTFAFSPTVTDVVETDTEYTVSYSLQTLAPQGDAWAPFRKTGEFSVAKYALPDTGLQGYVVQKLQDIENGERQYLARAQDTEKELAAKQRAQSASAFASLVGLALNQIPVPIVAKPASTPPMQNELPQTTETLAAASSVDTAVNADTATTTPLPTATSSAVMGAPQAATSTAAMSTTPVASSTATTTPDTAESSTAPATVSTASAPTAPESAVSSTSNASAQSDVTTSSAASTEAGSLQQADQQNSAPDTTAASTTSAD